MNQSHEYDKILTRLTIILQRLYEGESLSVSELAEEFGTSTKTIQRDLNERLIRFPIEKDGRRWKMRDGFRLEKSRSAEDELILDMLSEIAEGIGHSFGTKTKTLLSKLQNIDENPIYSKIAIEDLSDKAKMFKLLQDAIKEKKIVSFYFKDKYRFAKPYKIVSFEGYWYLYGEELLEEKLKTYYLKDISELKITTDTFTPNKEAINKLKFAINAWFEPNSELYEARLLALPEIAKYFYRRPLSASAVISHKRADGGIEITIKATSHNEILHEVKKWMPNLLVLEPKELVLKTKDIARELFDRQLEVVLEG